MIFGAVFRKLLQKWTRLNDWLRAFILAVLVLLFIHFFLLRFVSVRSTSMYATLLPGDLVTVTRWNTWTGFDRGDIVVFRDPIQDDRVTLRRTLLVKRIVGLPGDTVQLIEGRLFVNRVRIGPFKDETHSYLVRVKKDADPADLLDHLGLPSDFISGGHAFFELPLNKTMAEALKNRPEVVSVERTSNATGAPRHIFPFSPYYKWNTDDYGPLVVPRGGDAVRVNAASVGLYDRIITRYEGHRLEHAGHDLMIDGVVSDRYIVEQDHYFVLGDCRHFSSDSRYWGFVPEDHLLGRAAFVLLSSEQGMSGPRWGRALQGL